MQNKERWPDVVFEPMRHGDIIVKKRGSDCAEFVYPDAEHLVPVADRLQAQADADRRTKHRASGGLASLGIR